MGSMRDDIRDKYDDEATEMYKKMGWPSAFDETPLEKQVRLLKKKLDEHCESRYE